jgi:Flp pilus assembly protein TadD
VAILLIVYAVRSNLRARDWRNEFTLFGPELVVNPRSLAAHQVLGVTYSARGEYDLAAAHLEQALQTKPDDSRSLFNLGNLRLRFGQLDEAIALYRAALRKFPNHPRIHNNLGVALAQTGDLDGAEAEFRRALELQRDMPEAIQGLQGVAKMRAAGATTKLSPG